MSKGKLLVVKRENHILTLLLDNQRLLAANASKMESDSLVGNIYIGKVQNIVKNIEAAFVEITKGVLCFLSLSDLNNAIITNRPSFDGTLKVGDELLVQVSRDAMKTKQPAVTTKISLSGHYVVLSTGTQKLGISSKINKNSKKMITNELLTHNLIKDNKTCIPQVETKHDIPYGMVVRTHTGNLTDFAPLLEEWARLEAQYEQLMAVAMHRTCYSCLKKSPPSYLADLHAFYKEEYEEIVTDIPQLYEEIKLHLQETVGLESPPLRLYQDDTLSLSKLYSIESKLDTALNKHIWLKSGGYLVIEPTEALTVIDVNTGKYDAKKGSVLETFQKINLEAAEEIALQLRLRNLSGIIIVDFISTEGEDSQNQLLSHLRHLVKADSVRTNVIDITPLGLVEITRKKINKPFKEQLNS